MLNKESIAGCCIFLLLALIPGSEAKAGSRMKAGIATVDITPKESIMLVGYASRTEPSKGIIHPIYAKAIAFEDTSGMRAVLVTSDIIGFFRDFSHEIAGRVERELHIPRECLMLTSSHTHTAPLLHRSNLHMYDLSEQQLKTVDAYTKFLKKALFNVIQESLRNLAPVTISFGTGKAHIAINRRVFMPQRVVIGVNPDGPVDNQVPVMAFYDADSLLQTVLFGYACHGTTLKKDDYYHICGDYMGFAQEYLELSQPGITSLFVAGCSGDLNPYPRGTLRDARLHGLHLAGAVAAAIKPPMHPVRDPMRCSFRTVELPFARIPSISELRERAASENPHIRRNARYFLDILERGEEIPATYPYPVQVWQFGDDLTMIALGGEVVVDYAIRLKRELGINNIWTIAYANDVCGYIGSARTLYEGGYEADDSAIYYSLPSRWDFGVEERIISPVKEMVLGGN